MPRLYFNKRIAPQLQALVLFVSRHDATVITLIVDTSVSMWETANHFCNGAVSGTHGYQVSGVHPRAHSPLELDHTMLRNVQRPLSTLSVSLSYRAVVSLLILSHEPCALTQYLRNAGNLMLYPLLESGIGRLSGQDGAYFSSLGNLKGSSLTLSLL
ncbi:hypothetical protein BJ165DRAFT_352890 [Panaeolus papilionaceus]|nr:hypothetical protein BJ165DRAFT_352890 [Panaeolus papilionaceus]